VTRMGMSWMMSPNSWVASSQKNNVLRNVFFRVEG
jgi:hypothetical protein